MIDYEARMIALKKKAKLSTAAFVVVLVACVAAFANVAVGGNNPILWGIWAVGMILWAILLAASFFVKVPS